KPCVVCPSKSPSSNTSATSRARSASRPAARRSDSPNSSSAAAGYFAGEFIWSAVAERSSDTAFRSQLGGRSQRGPGLVPLGALLVGVSEFQDGFFPERFAEQLQADRQLR